VPFRLYSFLNPIEATNDDGDASAAISSASGASECQEKCFVRGFFQIFFPLSFSRFILSVRSGFLKLNFPAFVVRIENIRWLKSSVFNLLFTAVKRNENVFYGNVFSE